MSGRSPADGALLSDTGLPQRYSLERPIAQGGMGSVWAARDTLLGRQVALKLLPAAVVDDRAALSRFDREARAAARVSTHANVVTIFDVGETEPQRGGFGARPYIVMEYLPGGTVADALRAGAVERERALAWIAQAASALDYAHGQGVIHRDVKPANLLLDGQSVLHVGDFGIARLAFEQTITSGGQLFGTAAYLSPEQARGEPATAASDRYALAVVAFELLVGERPFPAEHFAAQARQHVEEPPPRPSSRNSRLPAAIDEVLQRGMAKSPEDRWPSCHDLAQALADAAPEPPAPTLPLAAPPGRTRRAAHPPAPAPATWQPLRFGSRSRARRLSALAALAVAALALATALLLAGSGNRKPAHPTASRAPARSAAGAAHPRPARSAAPNSAAVTASTPTTSSTATAPAGTSAGASADALEAQGHSLMLGGAYAQAVPILRRAVQTAAPGSTTLAYALFDLGRSLRLAGDPQSAAQVLTRRLQIPNQTGVVRQELELALAAARSQGPVATSPPDAGPGHGHGHGHGGGPG